MMALHTSLIMSLPGAPEARDVHTVTAIVHRCMQCHAICFARVAAAQDSNSTSNAMHAGIKIVTRHVHPTLTYNVMTLYTCTRGHAGIRRKPQVPGSCQRRTGSTHGWMRHDARTRPVARCRQLISLKKLTVACITSNSFMYSTDLNFIRTTVRSLRPTVLVLYMTVRTDFFQAAKPLCLSVLVLEDGCDR